MITDTKHLTGADLDYWTGRAFGIPADDLSFITVPRTEQRICVLKNVMRYDPSSSWMNGGTMMGRMISEGFVTRPVAHAHSEDDRFECSNYHGDINYLDNDTQTEIMTWGDTPLVAMCRAAVYRKFGAQVTV